MGAASLVLGIVALVIAVIFPYLGWLGILLAIAGIVLGAIGRKKGTKTGAATAGMVLSIIALALATVFWMACALCVSAASL